MHFLQQYSGPQIVFLSQRRGGRNENDDRFVASRDFLSNEPRLHPALKKHGESRKGWICTEARQVGEVEKAREWKEGGGGGGASTP